MAKVLVLRNCDKNLVSRNNFKYPAKGHVKVKYWSSHSSCGDGLHGFLWGRGDFGLAYKLHNAKWLVIEVDDSKNNLVKIDDNKVKFNQGNVVYCGDMGGAFSYIQARMPANLKSNSRLKISIGDSAEAKNINYKSAAFAKGSESRAIASADDSIAITNGNNSIAIAMADDSKVQSIGNASKAIGGKKSQVCAKGRNAVAIGGFESKFMAGENGIIVSAYKDIWGNPQPLVGFVGKNGIKANRWYKVVNDEFVLVP